MLLLELSGPLAKEPKFQKIMAVAVIDCLKANAENILPEVLFERLAQSRAELAFALSQRLLEVKSAEPEIKGILPVAWNTLRMHDSNMGSAFNREDADYYRILLRILYLALQLQTIDIDPKPSEDLKTSRADNTLARPHSPNSAFTIQTVLDIIGTIVAKGFRALTIVLHDTPTLVYPSDFSLITSILRSALRIPGVTRNTSHLMAAFSESQTARCASTLLSWADQLATNGDPIYGELSVSFLLEMSTVASLAESLAVEGVLSHILATNLIRVLQTKAFGPLDQPVRMHSIWVRGILPLLVNLLDAVGPPLAAEIAAALNQFPHQLARASNSFAVNSRVAVKTGGHNYITLSTASEAVTLSLIVSILQTFREAGASAAIVASEVDEVGWGSVQVKEDVEGWLQSRGALAERIVATNQREEAWSKQKPVQKDGGCDNRLEERVVEEMNMVVATLRGDNGE